jgi:exonuclease III
MKTTEFDIAKWNVLSMLQAGKMEEIADELKKYNIQITALQEVRWSQDSWIKKKNYTLLHSGLKTSKGQYGTGFLITEATRIVTKGLRKNLEPIQGKHSIDLLQKTAVLGTSHMI